MKYEVTLVKREYYEVEASDPDSALEIAFGLEEEDQFAWMDPVDQYQVRRMEDEN